VRASRGKRLNTNDDGPAWPSAARGWYLITVLMVAYVLSFIDRVVLGLLVGPIRADLHISDTQMSVLYGFGFAIFYTTLGLPIARLADRHDRRAIIAVGIAAWSLMTAACGIARNYAELLLARVGVGVGEAALSPAAYSMIADSFPEHKLGRALSVYTIGLPMGVGLALVIGGLVIQFVSNAPAYELPLVGTVKAWQVVFFIVGLPGLLVALWMATMHEPVRRKHAGDVDVQPSLGAAFAYLRSEWRAYTALILGFSVLGMVMNAVQIWGVQYYVRVLGFTLREAGLGIGLVLAIFGTVGVLAGGSIMDAMRKRGHVDAAVRTGLLAAACLIPFASTATLVSNPWVSLACLTPVGFFTAFAFGAGAAGMQVLTPSRLRAMASSIYLLFVNLIGIGLAPLFVAMLNDYVFADDRSVGKSVAIICGGATVVASLLFVWGLPHFRAVIAKRSP
jgi:MFS family permease